MAAANAELFYRAVNRVRPSLIRVEADEVTYNLHIMLRTEIEMALLEGAIAVDDLPDDLECQDARVPRVDASR